MIVPISLAVRFRWLVRLGLIGYALTDDRRLGHQGPVLLRPRTSPRRIEVALIFLLVVDFLRADGNPVKVVKREVKAGLAKIGRRPAGRRGRLTGRTRPGAGSVRRRGIRSTDPPEVPDREAPPRHPRARDRRARGGRLQLHQRRRRHGRPGRPRRPERPGDHRQGHQVRRVDDVAGPGRQAVPAHVHQPGERAAQRRDLHRLVGRHATCSAARSSASATKVYEVPALAAGSYFFRCDVHPDMQGTITAQ